MSNLELSIMFLLELAVILLVGRLTGLAMRRLGQPQVVSEMIAGVILGPSLFGVLWPEAQQWLFPMKSASMGILYAVSQMGLVLYMFCVGVEFRGDLLRKSAKSAVMVSGAGMLAPFVLGIALAWMLYRETSLFKEGIGFGTAALFMGAAICITAFPMLARIIYERRLSGTKLGTMALAAGSIDDVAAWCVLALVLAISGKQAHPIVREILGDDANVAIVAIGGGVIYAVVMWLIAPMVLAPFVKVTEKRKDLTPGHLTFVLMMVMVGACYTDVIGIYAVFGAFIFGACVPRGLFAQELQRKIEPLTTTLLLPLFFVYSGLNTKIGLVNTMWLWMVAGLVLAASCMGKGLACYAAARFNGSDRREAAAVGALMNSRGLMELILLNIAYDDGLITQTLFSILVIMAIVTTLMATPIFEWAYGKKRDELAAEARAT
ncbi:MAG TPA: cation:proton antiporter [Phycisphaerales bacterium]|nr:cation:proton antiporter [Phycisphaerales bacterium]